MKFVYKDHTVSVVASELADGSGWMFRTDIYSVDLARNVYSDQTFNTQEKAEQAGAAVGRDVIDGLVSGV